MQNGFTALHTAAKQNWLDVADLLLNHASDPNAQSVVSYHTVINIERIAHAKQWIE